MRVDSWLVQSRNQAGIHRLLPFDSGYGLDCLLDTARTFGFFTGEFVVCTLCRPPAAFRHQRSVIVTDRPPLDLLVRDDALGIDFSISSVQSWDRLARGRFWLLKEALPVRVRIDAGIFAECRIHGRCFRTRR